MQVPAHRDAIRELLSLDPRISDLMKLVMARLPAEPPSEGVRVACRSRRLWMWTAFCDGAECHLGWEVVRRVPTWPDLTAYYWMFAHGVSSPTFKDALRLRAQCV
jgi:hypothetical protein